MLTAEGLYEKEAHAMVETWRDHWWEEGLRAFHLLPRATTDAVLPLTIEPAAHELVRVMVTRVETVPPEMMADATSARGAMKAASYPASRGEARAALEERF